MENFFRRNRETDSDDTKQMNSFHFRLVRFQSRCSSSFFMETPDKHHPTQFLPREIYLYPISSYLFTLPLQLILKINSVGGKNSVVLHRNTVNQLYARKFNWKLDNSKHLARRVAKQPKIRKICENKNREEWKNPN